MEKGAFALYILTDRKSRSICIVSHGYKAAEKKLLVSRCGEAMITTTAILGSCRAAASTVVKAKRESIFGGSLCCKVNICPAKSPLSLLLFSF